jgi:hypothetical protein
VSTCQFRVNVSILCPWVNYAFFSRLCVFQPNSCLSAYSVKRNMCHASKGHSVSTMVNCLRMLNQFSDKSGSEAEVPHKCCGSPRHECFTLFEDWHVKQWVSVTVVSQPVPLDGFVRKVHKGQQGEDIGVWMGVCCTCHLRTCVCSSIMSYYLHLGYVVTSSAAGLIALASKLVLWIGALHSLVSIFHENKAEVPKQALIRHFRQAPIRTTCLING